MNRRTAQACAWVGIVVLLALHLDFWRPARVVFYGGWVVEELLYRVLWVALAWAYLVFVCAFVWRGEDDDVEGLSERRDP